MSEFPRYFFFFTFIILVNIGAVYAIYSWRENKTLSWRRFAFTNNLEFIPRHFLRTGTRVIGKYQGHFIELTTVKNPEYILHTHLTVFVNQLSNNQLLSNEQSVIKDLKSLFNSINTQLVLKDEMGAKIDKLVVYANIDDPAISYEQRGIETDAVHLQQILNVLCNLADYYAVVMRFGGRIVPLLKSVANDKKHHLRWVATGWLESIAEETKRRLASRASRLLCPHCLVHCGTHPINRLLECEVYYGCQICGQSQQFLNLDECQIVAELNNQSTVKQYQHNSVLRVNWLERGKLFYFDRIEIIQATDEEVEKFVVKVGNDTDVRRQPRYKLLKCELSPNCELSENTIRILKRTFGKVEIKSLEIGN